jgi:hypothetical protein
VMSLAVGSRSTYIPRRRSGASIIFDSFFLSAFQHGSGGGGEEGL